MAEDVNPYQAPATTRPARRRRSNSELATRGSRLVAAILDGIIMIAVFVPIQFAAGIYDDLDALQNQGIGELLVWTAVGFLATLAVNGYWLATRAQSIGKMALGIKIVTLDGNNADLSRIALRRILPIHLFSVVPLIAQFVWLIDVLFIFGKQRRCVHDLIAETRVVRVRAGQNG